MPPERNDEERREIIGRVKYLYEQAQTKRLNAEDEAAQFRQKEASLRDAALRAQAPFPSGDVCPECWIMHGKVASLVSATADDPRRYDRFRCGERCGYVIDRDAR
jgi:hypothetical protein